MGLLNIVKFPNLMTLSTLISKGRGIIIVLSMFLDQETEVDPEFGTGV